MLATTAFDLQNNNLKSPCLTQSFSTNDITTELARLRNKQDRITESLTKIRSTLKLFSTIPTSHQPQPDIGRHNEKVSISELEDRKRKKTLC